MASPAIVVDAAGTEVRISSPDRVMFPARGLTKRDVVDYYLAVGDGILGAVRRRPTTLERWPDGVGELGPDGRLTGESFYQKHVPKSLPAYADKIRITFPSGRPGTELCPDNLGSVIWAVQMNTLTFHPWPMTADDVDRPDQLRIDLDPQPGTDFADAVRVSAVLREVLDEHGLTGFPKTSGGRGLHVYVPIEPRWDILVARRAVIALGREMERRAGDQVTLAWWKEERGERIFLDYNQMARDRTIASAYSVRANPRATVSAPLTWDEAQDCQPEDFDVTTMPARYAEVGDLHAALSTADRGSIDSLLELSERDEQDRGLGDLPYPPDYPKMPGEPPRVQPSRMNPDNW